MRRLIPLIAMLAVLDFGGSPANAETFVLQIDMFGENVVPPVETPAWGFVRFFFNDDRSEATYTVDIKGYSGGAVTGADIREGAAGENGRILIHLADGDFIVTAGRLKLTAEQLEAFVSGNWYVTLTTTFHPEGEVRGQIIVPDDFLPGVAPSPPREQPATNGAQGGGGSGSIQPPNTGSAGLR